MLYKQITTICQTAQNSLYYPGFLTSRLLFSIAYVHLSAESVLQFLG